MPHPAHLLYDTRKGQGHQSTGEFASVEKSSRHGSRAVDFHDHSFVNKLLYTNIIVFKNQSLIGIVQTRIAHMLAIT